MEKNNIKHEKGTPYAHHYLKPVKRPMLTIANEIRTLLIDTYLPEELCVTTPTYQVIAVSGKEVVLGLVV
jgi:hypothetical protein